MEQTRPTTRPGVIRRVLGAIFAKAPLTPVTTSFRMPDLEAWKMPHRSVDMGDWTVALNMAQNPLRPDRSRLLDLYDSILVDSHLASVMESRVLRVVRSKFKLVGKDGTPRPELMELLEQRWFEDFLRYCAEATFRGHTLIELGQLAAPGQLKQVNRIDPRNVLPWTGHVVKRQGDEKGYPYREAPLVDYLVEVGRPDELGQLSQVAPVAIVKKYAVGSWSDYVEKFGIPARWVKSNTTDKNRVKQLEETMRQMISSAYAVIQGNEEIQVMPTPGTDAHKVFDELISRMNSEMSKRLLGQDGTSDNKDASGTYGSLKVLQGVAEDRHQADKASVGYVVNNELFPRLVKLGYPLAGIRFQWDELRDMSPTELVDAVTKLGQVFDIDPKHVEERTGIRILGARRMPGEVAPAGNPPGRGKQGKGDPAPSAKLKTGEGDDEDEDGGWPTLQVHRCTVCGGRRDIAAAGEPVIDQAVLEQLLRDVHDGAEWHQPYFEQVASAYTEGLLQTWRHDLDQLSYDAPDHVARTMMEANIFRFSGAKTQALVLDLNQLVRESKGLADFKRLVAERGLLDQYNKAWLQTEYVNAVNTGIQASRWHQMQRSSDALPFGEYWTQGDAQVRPVHRELNGKVWPLNDKVWNTIWPPNGWGCRCTVLPTAHGPAGEQLQQQTNEAMDTLEGTGELARMRKGGFASNRAITGQVFDLNRSYLDQLGEEAGKYLRLTVDDSYGAEARKVKWAALQKRDLPGIDSSTTTPAEATRWFDRSRMGSGPARPDDVIVMKDYAGRPIQMSRATLDKKLSKEPARASLADQLPLVLQQPDEVWMDPENKGDLVYVKFTKEGAIRVPVSVKRGEAVSVRSFYLATDDSLRNGLLIKRYNT